MKQIRRTAYHEAGHAVLAHSLGIGLQRVSLLADEDSSGHILDGGEYSEDTENLRIYAEEAFWLHMAIVRYAGAEAVRRLAPRSRWQDGAGDDYKWAAIALEKITMDGPSLRALHPYARRRARLLVENYWPEIGAVAHALMKRKELDQDRVRELFSASLLKRRGRRMSF
jgi:hypothetical protein